MSIDRFKKICEQTLDLAEYRYHSDVVGNVLVYDAATLSEAHRGNGAADALTAELNHCLSKGAGVYVVRNGFADHDLVARCNAVFDDIIEQEKRSKGEVGDHFAENGANDRIWNALQKTCLAEPQDFVNYYANDALAFASRAWLGPHYQMTAQVNVVKPGSKAQAPHRDYHLGFQPAEVVNQFPLHAQVLSQYLTLQCVIAHADMSLDSGPTKLLPFSQQYEQGYRHWRDEAFSAYFEDNYIQYPLQKGDIAFLNPALFHAAGANTTEDTKRVANLMQIVSCMSKPLEAVDNKAMVEVVYPMLLAGELDEVQCQNVIAAVAEGYSFPTNLDTDPPIGGSVPMSMAGLMRKALEEKLPLGEFMERVLVQLGNRRA